MVASWEEAVASVGSDVIAVLMVMWRREGKIWRYFDFVLTRSYRLSGQGSRRRTSLVRYRIIYYVRMHKASLRMSSVSTVCGLASPIMIYLIVSTRSVMPQSWLLLIYAAKPDFPSSFKIVCTHALNFFSMINRTLLANGSCDEPWEDINFAERLNDKWTWFPGKRFAAHQPHSSRPPSPNFRLLILARLT